MVEKLLERLMEGNRRFFEGKPEHPNRCQDTRNSMVEHQNPFAVIIACSDSRVPVEILFDVGIGDLFIVRTAGHVLTEASIASVEYAVEHLGVELVVVLGHHNCGAVKTTIADTDKHFSPSIETMIERIRPAVEKAKESAKNKEELLELAINYNVMNTIEFLKNSDPILKKAVQNKKLTIVGANYHIQSGKVEVLS